MWAQPRVHRCAEVLDELRDHRGDLLGREPCGSKLDRLAVAMLGVLPWYTASWDEAKFALRSSGFAEDVLHNATSLPSDRDFPPFTDSSKDENHTKT